MDLIYPRICQVTYDDVNYNDFEAYNYYNTNNNNNNNNNNNSNDLDYINGISNVDYMDFDSDSEDDNELVWRYSTKKNDNTNDTKRPKLKKSYTLFDNFYSENFLHQKYLSESDKINSASIFKSKLKNFHQNSPQSSGSHFNSFQQFNYKNDDKNSKQSKSQALPQSAQLLFKRKKDYYLEYINVINNPSLQPKYYTDVIKYKASEKKICEKFIKSASSRKYFQEINSIRNSDFYASNNRKPRRSEYLQKENEKLKNLDSASYDSFNKLKSNKKEKEKIGNLLPIQKENITNKNNDNDLSGNYNRKSKLISNKNLFNDKNDLESEERDIFYTDVDVLKNRRQQQSIQNNNSRISEKSPDIYTEIVKIPTNTVENISDDEYQKPHMGSKSKKNINNDNNDDKNKIKSKGNRSKDDNNNNNNNKNKNNKKNKNENIITPFSTPANTFIKNVDIESSELKDEDDNDKNNKNNKILKFNTTGSTEGEHEEEFCDENELLIDREIVKREKIARDVKKDGLNEPLDENTSNDVLNNNVEVVEIQIEKNKTPEVPENVETDEVYEITISMPDFSKKRESISIKPSNKTVIRLAPPVEKKPVEEKPKREKIDINSLKPKFNKRIQFDEEVVVEEEEEEEIIVNTDDWLAKWCIFREGQFKKFETIFDELDYMDKGYMNGENLIFALNRCLQLNNLKMTYLMRVMSLMDVDPFKFGANKKIFCVIAALGQRIQYLDDSWFKNLLPRLDVKSIENKVFKVKQLWDFLVDQDTKLVRKDDLMIEMRAGGVTDEHIQYAQEKFLEKTSFDLLDYLTYIPLFIHIHEKIVLDPFDRKLKI